MMMSQLQKILDPLKRRVMNTIARGVIQAVTDSTRIQKVQVSLLAGEVIDGLDRVQQYGFSSSPTPGAECVVLFLGGSRDHGVVIATDDRRTRPKTLSSGDTSLWTKAGTLLALRDATQAVEITAQKFKVSNGTNELIATLSELCQFLIDARVDTSMGPQPLIDPNDTISAIKAKIDGFKE